MAKWVGVGLQNQLYVGSIPTLESNLLQCHLTVRYSAHNRGYAGSTPAAATMHRWCNGNIPVSKTVVLGSSPSLCANLSRQKAEENSPFVMEKLP
jgi:hypothetical protein